MRDDFERPSRRHGVPEGPIGTGEEAEDVLMADLLYLIPLLPFLAFTLNLAFGRDLIREKPHWVALPALGASWVLSILALMDVRDKGEAISQHLYSWIPAGSFQVTINLYVDQ